MGFEPTVPFLTGHAISSRAPSASRASLQNNRVQVSVYSLHILIEKQPRFSALPFQAADCQPAAAHLEKRREWDSNPRTQFLELPLFESGAFNHSAISPLRARCMIHNAGYRKRTNPALQCPNFTQIHFCGNASYCMPALSIVTNIGLAHPASCILHHASCLDLLVLKNP